MTYPKNRESGSALYVTLVAVLMVMGFFALAFSSVANSSNEQKSSRRHLERLYLAEAGAELATVDLCKGGDGNLGSENDPLPLGEGFYWTRTSTNIDGTYKVRSTSVIDGMTLSVEAIVTRGAEVGGNVLFAGNLSGDPDYFMTLGGVAGKADFIDGDVFSRNDIVVDGKAQVTGNLQTFGAIIGAEGREGVTQPIPDLRVMDYEGTADVDVAQAFAESGTKRLSAAGGEAMEVPADDPAHIFRLNPSDRELENSSTEKPDYYLEDPAEFEVARDNKLGLYGNNEEQKILEAQVVPEFADLEGKDLEKAWKSWIKDLDKSRKEQRKSASKGSVAVSPVIPSDDEATSRRVYYIDGNLWVRNKYTLEMALRTFEKKGVRVTFAVQGNIYFSTDFVYESEKEDAVTFIALSDPDIADSGNICLGDLAQVRPLVIDAFLFAERDIRMFDLSGFRPPRIEINGFLSAANHIRLNDDVVDPEDRTQLIVSFDKRGESEKFEAPGFPRSARELDFAIVVIKQEGAGK